MSKDFTPEVAKAISLAHKVPGAGETAESIISNLWGDVGQLEKMAQFWKGLSMDASLHIVSKLGDESRAISDEHWSGKAKTAYTTWISDLEGQTQRIQDSLWQIGVNFEEAKVIVESMRSDIRKMALWLIGAVAGLVVAREGSAGVGAGAVALCVWEFIEQLNDYYSSGTEKFAGATTALRDLREQSRTLVSYEDGVMNKSIPIPVEVPTFAPELPFLDVGDWRNWGKADPNSRK
jgi:uncharacterized protein YukE